MRGSGPLNQEVKDDRAPKKQRPIALENGKFFDIGEVRMLYGGEDSIQHCNIEGCHLNEAQFLFQVMYEYV